MNNLSKAMVPEYDQEMATTRRVLERVPEGDFEWRPHAKSMTIGRLATHVAELAGWAPNLLQRDSLDIAPPDGPGYKPQTLGSRQEILDLFDKNVATTRELLASTDDETFMQPWTFLRGGQTIFTLPRAAVVRTMLFNHIIHHRGQLTVYLRLNDAPVPSVYGPTADEPLF
ncbi:MAG TPA: DinB family protein [Thermoanaerobaculia bacterium]|nr:DinB family protein [Thermoanaerobaculia bacterium]